MSFLNSGFEIENILVKTQFILFNSQALAILPGTQLDRTMSKEEFYHPKAAQARRTKQFNDMAQVVQECGFETHCSFHEVYFNFFV
jgi:hypothetical protein